MQIREHNSKAINATIVVNTHLFACSMSSILAIYLFLFIPIAHTFHNLKFSPQIPHKIAPAHTHTHTGTHTLSFVRTGDADSLLFYNADVECVDAATVAFQFNSIV